MRGKIIKTLLITLGIVCVIEAAVIQTISGDVSLEEIKPITFEHITKPIYGVSGAEAAGETIIKELSRYSDEDADRLMRIAMAEAGNQHEDGMWLVMSVVINRVESDAFPDSIREVIAQQNAFSSVNNGTYYLQSEISEECRAAYERVKRGDVAPEIIAFERIESKVLDRYFLEAFTFKEHKFYTLR